MPSGTSKKLTLAALAIFTLIVGVLAVIVSIRLQQNQAPSDSSATTSSSSSAVACEPITFDNVPGVSGAPAEGTAVTNHYRTDYKFRFSNGPRKDGATCDQANPVIAVQGEPERGFEYNETDSADTPAPGQTFGPRFLTNRRDGDSEACTLVITFDNNSPTKKFSFDILDVDDTEAWQVQAFTDESATSPVATKGINLGETKGDFDGIAKRITFNLNDEIKLIKIVPKGEADNNFGLGFDNFTPYCIPGETPPAEIVTTKSVVDINGGNVEPEDILEYTLRLQNTGGSTAENVRLSDGIPAKTVYVDGSLKITGGANAGDKTDETADDQAEYRPGQHRVLFRLGNGADGNTGGNIAAGNSGTVKFRVQVVGNAEHNTTISNFGTVTFENDGNEETADSNQVDVVVKVPTVVVPGTGQLDLTKSVTDLNGGLVAPGDVLEYAISVHNVGDSDATGVMLEDTIDSDTTYTTGTIVIDSATKTDTSGDDQAEYTSSTKKVTARLGTGATATAGGTLAADATVVVKFRATVPSTAVTGTVITNSAIATYGDETDEDKTSTSNQTTVTVNIVALPDTALSDDQTKVLIFGLLFMMIGVVAIRYRLIDNVVQVSGISNFLTWIAPENKQKRKINKSRAKFEKSLTD